MHKLSFWHFLLNVTLLNAVGCYSIFNTFFMTKFKHNRREEKKNDEKKRESFLLSELEMSGFRCGPTTHIHTHVRDQHGLLAAEKFCLHVAWLAMKWKIICCKRSEMKNHYRRSNVSYSWAEMPEKLEIHCAEIYARAKTTLISAVNWDFPQKAHRAHRNFLIWSCSPNPLDRSRNMETRTISPKNSIWNARQSNESLHNGMINSGNSTENYLSSIKHHTFHFLYFTTAAPLVLAVNIQSTER